MTVSTIIYRDVTGNLDAEPRASHAPELRTVLATCGFQRVGLLEVRYTDTTGLEEFRRLLTGSDADLLQDIIEHGETVEILTSRDERAFASVEPYYGGPVVVIRTIFEPGIVVETAMKPHWRPPSRAAPLLPFYLKYNPLVDRITSWIGDHILGSSELWPRSHAPGAGLYVALVDTRDPAALWQHHQQRVDTIIRTSNPPIRSHTTLTLYIAINQRVSQVSQQHTHRATSVSSTVAGVLSPLSLGWILLLQYVIQPGPLSLLDIELIILIAAIPLLLIVPVIRVVRGKVLPRLPGLPLHPVEDLLRDVQLIR